MMNIRTLLLVVGSAAIWIIESLFGSLVFSEGSLADLLLLRVPSYQVYYRLAVISVFILFLILAFRSTSAQKLILDKLTESQDRYRSLLDHLPVGVYRATPGGRILEANQRFAQLLGYENHDDLGNVNLNDVYVRKSDRTAHLDKLRESPVFAEFELRRKDGRTVWVRDFPKAAVDREGNISYVDGVFVESHGIDAIMRDITEHRRLESIKDQFISAVTHELRTPIISIKGYLDYILSQEPKPLVDGIRSKIEIVKRNADRLLDLTNDLLEIHRMESGALQLKVQTFDLRDILKQCSEDIQPLLGEKNQQLHADMPATPVRVQGDPLRVHQVVMNLLDNAMKFTRDGGQITLGVEENSDVVRVRVADSGIGIDKKDLERVFDPFAAIEKPTYFKGTGLGLSLTKKLVEAHGGKIWASSGGKGQGSTFAFTLPKHRVVEIRA